MIIVGYIALGWLGLCVLATFGWVILYELCARRSRAGRPRRGATPPAHAPRACLPVVARATKQRP